VCVPATDSVSHGYGIRPQQTRCLSLAAMALSIIAPGARVQAVCELLCWLLTSVSTSAVTAKTARDMPFRSFVPKHRVVYR
jgi:hypothetical protein